MLVSLIVGLVNINSKVAAFESRVLSLPSSRTLPIFRSLFSLDLSKKYYSSNDDDDDEEQLPNNTVKLNSTRSTTWHDEAILEFEFHSSIASISPEAWNACLPTKQSGLGSAFLDYSWFHCLEESKCASPQTGWVPQHVSIKIQGEVIGFLPLYIKSHSSK